MATTSYIQLYSSSNCWLAFLQNVEMFPEYVADVERSALQQTVSSLLQQIGAAAAVEPRRINSLEGEVLDGPLEPQLNVLARPTTWICTTLQHVHEITISNATLEKTTERIKQEFRTAKRSWTASCDFDLWELPGGGVGVQFPLNVFKPPSCAYLSWEVRCNPNRSHLPTNPSYKIFRSFHLYAFKH